MYSTSRPARGTMHAALLLLALVAALALAAPTAGAAGARSGSTRIFDGEQVDTSTYATRWPWVVSLQYYSPFEGAFPEEAASLGPIQRHACGGSLVAPTIVVTAAHCVVSRAGVDEPDHWKALVGRRNLRGTGGQMLDVRQVWVHPSYDNDNRGGYDVAVMRLAAPATGITPVRLVQPGDAARWGGGAGMPIGADGPWIAGWGARLSFDGETFSLPGVLHQGAVPIHSDEACLDGGPGAGVGWGSRFFMPRAMLCAGELNTSQLGPNTSNGTSPCNGDSGGPLVVGDGLGGYLLAGIVSFGVSGCASRDVSAVFTRVDAIRPWVEGAKVVPPRQVVDWKAIIAAELSGDWDSQVPGLAGLRGDPVVGNQLTCASGRWTGPDVRFSYRWFTTPAMGDGDDGVGDFLDEIFSRRNRALASASQRRFSPEELVSLYGGRIVADARGSRYVPRSADVGRTLHCIVTARNAGWVVSVVAEGAGTVEDSGHVGNAAMARLRITSKRCLGRSGSCTIRVAVTGTGARGVVRVGGWAVLGRVALPLSAQADGSGTWIVRGTFPHGQVRLQLSGWDDVGRRSPRAGGIVSA